MIFIRNATRNVLKLKITTLYVGISINNDMYVLGNVDVYFIDVYNDIVLRLMRRYVCLCNKVRLYKIHQQGFVSKQHANVCHTNIEIDKSC